MMNNIYFPHTEEDVRIMLEQSGIKDLDGLYADVPENVLFKGEYDLPQAMSELDIRRHFEKLGQKNRKLTLFCGMGAYDHYAPAVIPYLLSRSEFLTAYTPYQAEVAQGTLRYIFEFQTMMAELTGMDCSNASMYDGATAAAEVMLMAFASTRKKTRFLISSTLPTHVKEVIETYALYQGFKLDVIAQSNGNTDLNDLQQQLASGDVSGVLVSSINKYGIIEDHTGFSEAIHSQKALFAIYSDPSALAVIKSPGEWGADIACGDGQTLGMPLHFGGPYVGFLCCKKELVRKLPGRIVGATKDTNGKRAFVLTLQAREQHIRREKANSNICSNQSLMALYATVYLSLMGPEGMKQVNEQCYGGAHELYQRLLNTGKFTPVFDRPFLKEFVVKSTLSASIIQKKLLESNMFGALETEEGYLSFCVTEKRTREEIDQLIAIIEEIQL